MTGGLGPQNGSGGNNASASLTEEVPINVAISEAAPAGTVFPNGMTLTELAKAIGQNIFVPTLISPSFSLNQSGSSLKKIGTTANFDLTFNFNRGQIKGANDGNGDWDENLPQNDRAGVSNDYQFDGVSNGNNNVKSISETVVQGIVTHTAIVNYEEGAQPKKSDDSPYDNPLPAGSSPTQTESYEGVYPLFATTSGINTATEQSLKSMLNANNIVFDLVAESGGNKQYFDIPDAWLAQRSLSSVQYFNTVSGSFDTTNKLSDFTQSAITKTVAGTSGINYTRFTYNGSDRGSIKIKLIF